MSEDATEVWITGIGLVTSLGEGNKENWAGLQSGNPLKPSVDDTTMAPYPFHPLVEYDISKQIPKRSDQRQMGPWQRLGVYSAGLALEDAGIAHNQDLLAKTNMIVAAGGGKRDEAVDSAIMAGIGKSDNPGAFLNATLSNELRPTLFLAQLSNLMAGNISIVHGVTDSSRTFMGEEMAGVSAVETAVRQIQCDQGDVFLVGGAYIADRMDMILLFELGHTLWYDEYRPVWSRAGALSNEHAKVEGGMIMGSAGVFLILESKKHAEARGIKPYARIRQVLSDRSNRKPGAATKVAEEHFDRISEIIPTGPLPILSGASGVEPHLSEEQEFLLGLAKRGYDPALRGVSTVFGNTVEAQFPLGVALAALAISNGSYFGPFDNSGVEAEYTSKLDRVLLSNWGHWRGESLALVDTPAKPLRGKS